MITLYTYMIMCIFIYLYIPTLNFTPQRPFQSYLSPYFFKYERHENEASDINYEHQPVYHQTSFVLKQDIKKPYNIFLYDNRCFIETFIVDFVYAVNHVLYLPRLIRIIRKVSKIMGQYYIIIKRQSQEINIIDIFRVEFFYDL